MSDSIAIGLMSGSSLDGIDLVAVRFQSHYQFEILHAETLPYPKLWQQRLANAFLSPPEALTELDRSYGLYLGQQIRDFIHRNRLRPDFVASHGHTIFHKPEQQYTLQIGDGQCIADTCGVLTINDFRTEDVSKGGQGAPLVPIGDKLLFSDYEICLNIGGIANLSYDEKGRRIAYDICIANQALNFLAQREGLAYDKDGALARNGHVVGPLSQALDNNAYYRQAPPKSLGREFFETYQKTLLETYPAKDALATFTEHVALQIANSVNQLPTGKMLVTGGGANNTYLVERIQRHTPHQVCIPDRQTIDYKEALIFALLGLLRLERKTNVLCSVTGASSDSCSGKIWTPNS